MFKKTIVTTLITALLTPSISLAGNNIDMIDTVSSSITKNNLSEFMTSLPSGVQTQTLYAQTSGRPFITAIQYPDEGVTMIFMVSSEKDFKTGDIKMKYRRLSPREEARSWMESPRGKFIYGGQDSPVDPFSQFIQTRGLTTIGMDDGLSEYNWMQANTMALPAILSALALKYNAQKVGMINLQTVWGVHQWEDKDKWGITVDYYAQSKTWVKPQIFMADYRENAGTMGSITSYKIPNCTVNCDVVSGLKFIQINTNGDAKTKFSLVHDSGGVKYDSGFNSLVVAVVGLALGCPMCSAMFLTQSLLQGNSLTNSYMSADKMGLSAVMTALNPVTAAAAGGIFTEESELAGYIYENKNAQIGSSGMGGTTDSTLISVNGKKIDRATLENAQKTVVASAIDNSKLQEAQESREAVLGAYKALQQKITESAAQLNTGEGVYGKGEILAANRYEIAGKGNFNPVGSIMNQYIRNSAFVVNPDGTITTNFGGNANDVNNRMVNNTFNKNTSKETQEENNDIELLRKIANNESLMLQMGGSSYINELRKSSNYNGSSSTICLPSPDNPCSQK